MAVSTQSTSSIIMFLATGDGKESEPGTSSSPACRHFDFPEIQLATDNFNESLVVGEGGFGKVYKGTILNGSTPVQVAIKRLDKMSSQGVVEFWAEVEMLSKFRHCNLVFLIGYCAYKIEMIIVYEYMPHGTLSDHLHKLCTPLSWLQRLKICIGAARGLHYLHTGTGIEFGIIHRDVKSTNILLHESWEAKISDFGLSKKVPTNQTRTYVNTHVKGTFGYFDPDYFCTGKLTKKSDVYAFGVVLLEVLCRKRAVDSSLDAEQWSLSTWALEGIEAGHLRQIIDSDIKDQIRLKCLKEFVGIARRCLHSNPKKRPTMAEVLVSLESIMILQEKTNHSWQAAGRTIFGKMVNMLHFPSDGENSAHGNSKLSSKSKSNSTSASNTLMGTREVLEDLRIPHPSLKVIDYTVLESATRNFNPDLRLAKGGFGEAFIGWVDKDTFCASTDGVGIAVTVKKRNHNSIPGHAKWLMEVSLLGGLAHPNVISLLGYCSDEDKYLLVYEYMQNKNLGHFLYGDAIEPLSWGTRLGIMIGVARGLTFLHSLKEEVVCCGVKSSDILLDQDFNAKLGDFGVARFCPKIRESVVSTIEAGTFGYIDPHYYMTGHLTAKTDIYGLGVVLLETLTGLRAWDVKRPDEKQNLVCWAIPILERKEITTILDPHLEQNFPLGGAFKCAALVLRCLADKPKNRPSSKEVLRILEQISDS